jgi:hypothetical protein
LASEKAGGKKCSFQAPRFKIRLHRIDDASRVEFELRETLSESDLLLLLLDRGISPKPLRLLLSNNLA